MPTPIHAEFTRVRALLGDDRLAQLVAERLAAPRGECAFCDDHRHSALMPAHTASPDCRSGGRDHCDCPICF